MNDRSVLVLGLGESGLAMARWCRREGATVRVADTRVDPPKRPELDDSFDVRTVGFTDDLLDGIDLIAISPGLALTAEPQAALLATARARGIEVVGEIELFARKLAALSAERAYAPHVIAITGTNGKTTVTRLVGRLCEAANVSAVVAGNVSPAALDALADVLDREALPAVWVLELSSFQLASTTSLVATAATVLNITQDHLDWHGTMDAYAQAKAAIFAPSTVRVLNRDDARVIAMDAPDAPSVRFGLDAPTLPGDLGVVRDREEDEFHGAMRWLALAEGEEPEVEARGFGAKKVIAKRRASKVVPLESIAPVRTKRLMPVDALRIRGDHNVANALAALGLGRAIGLSMGAMLRALTAYRGEPHRAELVRTIGGVDYVEDSKGTNVGATVAALNGLHRKVVLIAGGLGKGQDFTPLALPVAAHARAVFLIGRDRGAIRAALAETGVTIVECESLESAVDEAAAVAESGDAVLLSPACASMDMFRDYAHRAAVFVAAVERLADDEREAHDVAEGATC